MGKETKKNTKEKNIDKSVSNVDNEIKTSKKNEKKSYISFSTKILIYSILFVSTLFLSLFLLITSFTIREEENVNYQENSNIDYKVFLKENDYR